MLLTLILPLLALAATATEAEAETAIRGLTDRDKAARDALGLPATATPDQVTAAVSALQAEAELGHLAVTELKWTGGLPGDAGQQLIRTLKHSGYVPYDEHAAVLRSAGEREQQLTDEQLVERARAEGKLTPAQEPWFKAALKRDPAGARAWLATAPKVAPVIGRPGAGDPPLPAADVLTDSQRKICRQLGFTEAQYSDQLKAERNRAQA